MDNKVLIINRLLSCSEGEEKSILYLNPGDSLPAGNARYDAIVCIGCLEVATDPVAYLVKISEMLKDSGRVFVFADNRLGLRYFSGELDPFTHRFGAGIEQYIHYVPEKGRCYSLEELRSFLTKSGFSDLQIYSLLPHVDQPKFVISEHFLPSECMSIRYSPSYRNTETVFFQEEYVVDSLLRNHLLPAMANGILLEASRKPFERIVDEIIFSSERLRNCAMETAIFCAGTVEKRPMYTEGYHRPEDLLFHESILQQRGVRTIHGRVRYEAQTPVYSAEYCDAPLANTYLKDLFFKDRELFIREMDRFREKILAASEILPGKGHVQKKAFPDMVPLNCFVIDGDFVFFDQEFSRTDYPADSIIARSILIVYELDMKMELALPKSFFYDRYGLTDDLDYLLAVAREFTDAFSNPDVEARLGRRDNAVLARNRVRMNYSEELYEKLTYNPVAGLEHKELYLFGVCDGTAKFIEMYQRDFTIRAVLVSEEKPSMNEFAGYPVISPNALKKEDPATYRVVICTPEYEGIRQHLIRLGVADCAVYQPEKVYPGRQATALYTADRPGKKPYHIGYIAGVFDLFHIGHLNMFRRAKEMCDYLIVGIVTDAGVRDFKKTEPYIPFDERMEMVRGCRYVDEVVEIPYFNRGTIEAFEKYHFDVQFSGSDYQHEPLWLYHKAWLEERGATMVFFPYTQGTSSSKIKKQIDTQL